MAKLDALEKNDINTQFMWGAHGNVMVGALCYKPEGPGFQTRTMTPELGSSSNRNEYQESS
jgi:hypothetical protein